MTAKRHAHDAIVPLLGSGADATVRRSLEGSGVHEGWEAAYRTEANERFYDLSFDVCLEYAGAPAGTEFLDVGCGPGFHALRLARRGYRVRAVDFSPFALELARENIEGASMQDRVRLGREDMLALSFGDRSFHRILCWGVLMHIPDVERAISELGRVLAPGGMLIVSELNRHSPEATIRRAVRRARRRATRMRSTPAGVEDWDDTPAGRVMTRQANIDWLVEAFDARALRLVKRLPGQFSEAYVKLRSPLAGAVDAANRAWMRHARSPSLACGNILILQKPATDKG